MLGKVLQMTKIGCHLLCSDKAVCMQDMQQKADVIVTEIFDSELLGEGILPSLRHALSTLAKVCPLVRVRTHHPDDYEEHLDALFRFLVCWKPV